MQLIATPRPVSNARYEVYETTKGIGAVRIDFTPDKETRSFCQLQAGCDLFLVGPGFDERTVLVRCENAMYVVFCSDLDCCAVKPVSLRFAAQAA